MFFFVVAEEAYYYQGVDRRCTHVALPAELELLTLPAWLLSLKPESTLPAILYITPTAVKQALYNLEPNVFN